MDIRQLTYFLAVAEEGLITKAAHGLHITQSPLSQQMIALEKELDVQLFQRDKKHIVLTKAGILLKRRAEQLVALAQNTRAEVKETAHGLQGRLTIGTINSSGRFLLPEVITFFHKNYPQIFFDLRQGDTPYLLELLNAHLIDLAFVRLPVNNLQYMNIAVPAEHMSIAAAPDYFTLPEKAFPLIRLKNVPLLIHRRYQATITEYFQKLDCLPNIFCISDEVLPLLTWALEGLGLAIIPEFAPPIFANTNLNIKQLSDPLDQNSSALIWLKKDPPSTAAANFITCFRKQLEKQLLLP